MLETYHLTSAQDNLTGEFRQVGYMKFENEASRIMQFWFWAFIAIMATFVFYFLARVFGKLPEGFRIGTSEIVIGIIVIAATLVIHEWIHALTMRRYGARPEFGMSRNKVVATITAPGYGFRRNTVILVALFALIAVVNAASAVNDFWIIGFLLRYPNNAWAVDDKDGMRILMPKEKRFIKECTNAS